MKHKYTKFTRSLIYNANKIKRDIKQASIKRRLQAYDRYVYKQNKQIKYLNLLRLGYQAFNNRQHHGYSLRGMYVRLASGRIKDKAFKQRHGYYSWDPLHRKDFY
jgi:hypothetical protein